MTKEKIKELIEDLEKIVCTEGEDAGVIFLSHESTGDWNEEYECYVYENEYFSPLGEALVKLYKKMKRIERECK